MTPIEECKNELRRIVQDAATDDPTLKRYTAQLAAVEALEADLESTRRALETEVAENAKLREALERISGTTMSMVLDYEDGMQRMRKIAAQVLAETGGKS